MGKKNLGALHSPFFAILHHKSFEWKNLRFLGNFFSLHIQNRKDPHKISFSEPAALFMKFPTHVLEIGAGGKYGNFMLGTKNRLF